MNITTIKKISEKHDGLTESAVRFDIFNAERNGLAESGAIVRKGRRIYLIEERYLNWLLSGVEPRGRYVRKLERDDRPSV